MREPDLLLLDEPFGALDALTRLKAQQLVAELWQRRGCAVLLVTHDVGEALLLADRALVMRDGVIAYETPVALDRPRAVGDPAFAALRSRLLTELGVDEPAAQPSASCTSSHQKVTNPDETHPSRRSAALPLPAARRPGDERPPGIGPGGCLYVLRQACVGHAGVASGVRDS
ncbi:ABC-type sulfate/molybdate transport systems ATPase subunit [Streptomyces sp. V1I1]|nr:ABC-type sulfate/molybdate transport systems ATPase subunit [Streptomyces sp. V1I1]